MSARRVLVKVDGCDEPRADQRCPELLGWTYEADQRARVPTGGDRLVHGSGRSLIELGDLPEVQQADAHAGKQADGTQHGLRSETAHQAARHEQLERLAVMNEEEPEPVGLAVSGWAGR